MHKAYELVVFDWEGTLGDTLGKILYALKTAAVQLGLGEVQEAYARQCLGFGLAKAVEKIFPFLTEAQHKLLVQQVHDALSTNPLDVWLVPGAEDIIQKIHKSGCSLAIATNKSAQSLQRALDLSGLDKFFKVTRSAGQVPAKPCPQMLLEIMGCFGAGPKDTVMIGDSVSDVEMANLAGVDALGVNFYQQEPNELLAIGAKAVFDDYQKLASYLKLP